MDNPKKPSPGWGARIYEARAAMKGKRGKRMTQGELGDSVGKSDSQIGWYENEINIPSQEVWLAIADTTATRFEWLVYGRGTRDSEFAAPHEEQGKAPRPRARLPKGKRGR